MIAPFDSTIVPSWDEPLGLLIALTRAQAIVYGQEIQKGVRHSSGYRRLFLRRIQGQVNVSEYNRRVTRHIQKEIAVWDKLEADMASLLREMDRRY